MEANPYLPPEAAVADAPVAANQVAPAFAVSITKLVVMSIATLGLYQLYWFYQHWAAIKRRTKQDVSPVWRAIFGVFWCYSCFREIDEEARRHDAANKLPFGALAATWIVLTLVSRLPDPYWVVSLLAFVVLVPVQKQANALNAQLAPEADRNSRFNWMNITWLAISVPILALAMIGLMLPPE